MLCLLRARRDSRPSPVVQGSEARVLDTVDPRRFDMVLVELEHASGAANMQRVRGALRGAGMVQLPLAARAKAGRNELFVRPGLVRDVRPSQNRSFGRSVRSKAGTGSANELLLAAAREGLLALSASRS